MLRPMKEISSSFGHLRPCLPPRRIGQPITEQCAVHSHCLETDPGPLTAFRCGNSEICANDNMCNDLAAGHSSAILNPSRRLVWPPLLPCLSAIHFCFSLQSSFFFLSSPMLQGPTRRFKPAPGSTQILHVLTKNLVVSVTTCLHGKREKKKKIT